MPELTRGHASYVKRSAAQRERRARHADSARHVRGEVSVESVASAAAVTTVAVAVSTTTPAAATTATTVSAAATTTVSATTATTTAVSATATAASAAEASTATTAPTTGTSLTLFGLVDAERPAFEHGAVHLLNRRLCELSIAHGHEAEASRLTGRAIHDHVDIGDFANLGERSAQDVLRGVERQIAHVKSIAHRDVFSGSRSGGDHDGTSPSALSG